MKLPKFGKFLKEPIVQFIILGALLFVLDRMLIVNRDDPRNILVNDNQIQEFVEIFEEGQGRPPSGKEINNMLIIWAQNEILYREARSMGLDRGDDMIRNRLILKIRNVLFNNVVINDPTDAQLQEFFEFNKAAYSVPARYDIEMIILPSEYDLSAAQAVLDQILNEGMPASDLGIRHEYKGRAADNLVEMFGDQAGKALLSKESKTGTWALISVEQKHLLARITGVRDAVEPTLASVRSRVMQDYERYIADTQISEQTHNIASRYQVRLDVSDAYLAKMESELPRNPFQDAPAVSEMNQNLRSELVVDER